MASTTSSNVWTSALSSIWVSIWASIWASIDWILPTAIQTICSSPHTYPILYIVLLLIIIYQESRYKEIEKARATFLSVIDELWVIFTGEIDAIKQEINHDEQNSAQEKNVNSATANTRTQVIADLLAQTPHQSTMLTTLTTHLDTALPKFTALETARAAQDRKTTLGAAQHQLLHDKISKLERTAEVHSLRSALVIEFGKTEDEHYKQLRESISTLQRAHLALRKKVEDDKQVNALGERVASLQERFEEAQKTFHVPCQKQIDFVQRTTTEKFDGVYRALMKAGKMGDAVVKDVKRNESDVKLLERKYQGVEGKVVVLTTWFNVLASRRQELFDYLKKWEGSYEGFTGPEKELGDVHPVNYLEKMIAAVVCRLARDVEVIQKNVAWEGEYPPMPVGKTVPLPDVKASDFNNAFGRPYSADMSDFGAKAPTLSKRGEQWKWFKLCMGWAIFFNLVIEIIEIKRKIASL